ncbi:MAG: T9SS type A sorting domain-containing protein [Saprospiraceae bacterium]|nr:T9SS type A sorting domain-containing protein [Saprospiraceae bacterium]
MTWDLSEASVHPNPATDMIRISADQAVSYSIINMSGQTVKQGAMQNDNIIDISHLSSGTYIVDILVHNNKHIIQKLIKK